MEILILILIIYAVITLTVGRGDEDATESVYGCVIPLILVLAGFLAFVVPTCGGM